MKALVVLAHPLTDSLNHRIAERAVATLADAGHDVRLLDLYVDGFDPRLTVEERRRHYDPSFRSDAVREETEALLTAEILVLVFPVWWFGPPAILKGWIDRVFAPGIAFDHGRDFGPIVPRLTALRHAVVIATYGSPWWLDRFVLRRPVYRVFRHAIMRGCAPQARFHYKAMHAADAVEAERAERFMVRVAAMLRRL